jgi:short-chain fatty acids transporter
MTREMQPVIREQPLVRFGLALANWSERCFPDPLVFALIGIVVVFVVGILLHQSPAKLAVQGGKNFWAFNIGGLIPLTQTLFLWQSIATTVILIVLSVLISYLSTPSPENAKTAESYGIRNEPIRSTQEPKTKPGDWLEHSPLLTILVVAFLCWYLVDTFRTSPQGVLAALDLNTYDLMFITVGLLFHRRPKRFKRAVSECIPTTGGAIIQFPFYAVILGMIAGTGIADTLARLFASISTHNTYPLLVAMYSALLGVFIPSGSSKWVIEAPYVLQAAKLHQVNLGWVVQIYNASEALPNLVNPFWMLPLLGILRLKARDIVGYGALQLTGYRRDMDF